MKGEGGREGGREVNIREQTVPFLLISLASYSLGEHGNEPYESKSQLCCYGNKYHLADTG